MSVSAGPAAQHEGAAKTTAAVAGLGALTVASHWYALPARIPDLPALTGVALVQAVLFVCAAAVVLRTSVSRPAFAIILLVGLLCRAPLLPAPPRFSDDVYRYVWDGRVQAMGVNPYRYVPADPALAGLRDAATYPHINRRDYGHTAYPPVAEMIFLAVTRVSATVTGMKAGMVAFEAITVWMLTILLGRLGLPRGRVLLYAWNPLVIQQYAGDGHIDAAAIAFVAVALVAHARRWKALTGVALGCATLVKWYPGVLFPALYHPKSRAMPLAMAATIVIAYLPYLGVGRGIVGFLPRYAQEEGLLSGDRFFLLTLARMAGAAVPTAVYVAVALGALLLIGVRALRQTDRTALGDIGHAGTLAIVFMLLLSTHYLWYFGWLALFLAVVPAITLLYLASAATYLFAALPPRPSAGFAHGLLSFDIALYVPLGVFALAERRRTREGRHRSAGTADGEGRGAGIGGAEVAGTET